MKMTPLVAIVSAILMAALTLLLVRHSRRTTPATPPPAQVAATIHQIEQVNESLPELQIQAKLFITMVIMQKQIPAATNWCDALNLGGKLWPRLPTNTVFAMNPNFAGRAYTRDLPGDAVLFFETDNPGWNQTGGVDLLSHRTEGVAVAFVDGRALVVSPREVSQLHW